MRREWEELAPAWMRAFTETEFALEDVIEPTVDAETLARYPELDDEARAPNFIIYILRKPGRWRVSVAGAGSSGQAA